jgi:hypothetical protein
MANEPLHTNINTVNNAASVKAVDAAPNRASLVLTNTESVTMWAAVSQDGTEAAVSKKGIPLYPGVPTDITESAGDTGDAWASGQVNVISESAAAPQVLAIFESYKD